MSKVRFRSESCSGPVQSEVVRQLVASKNAFHQILGIYGYEEGDREADLSLEELVFGSQVQRS